MDAGDGFPLFETRTAPSMEVEGALLERMTTSLLMSPLQTISVPLPSDILHSRYNDTLVPGRFLFLFSFFSGKDNSSGSMQIQGCHSVSTMRDGTLVGNQVRPLGCSPNRSIPAWGIRQA